VGDDYTVEDAADAATRMLRHRVPDAEIKDLLPDEMADEAWRIARLRARAADRFEDPWELFFTEEGLRYATPDVVARARADRLAGHGAVAVDVACGAGIQLGFLARRFGTAVGIELDPDKAELARRNLEALDADAEVIVGDALDRDVIDRVPEPDVVVCDPARAPQADERTFEGLEPDLREVHTTWGEPAAAACYELPPMMPPDRVHPVLDGECEYTSLASELNRLAVYAGEAAGAREAALALPEGERLADADPAREVPRVDETGEVLHRVERSVLQADLLAQLAERIHAGGLLDDGSPRRTLLTSDAPGGSALARDFEVLGEHAWNLLGLHELLDRVGAGSVTLRASVDPDRYWDVRNALEEGLEGDRSVHVFRVDDRGIIAAPVEA
jgi:protein-L-isoaspartate O-methyltransferase